MPVDVYPEAMTYDPANGDLYVCGFGGADNLTVISTTRNRAIASIPIGDYCVSIAYDPVNGDLYTANYNSINVSVIDGATNRVIATLSGLPGRPSGIVADSRNGEVFIGTANANVTVVNGTTNTIVANIVEGADPWWNWGIAYDNLTDEIYLAGSSTIWVVSGSSNSVVANVSIAGASSTNGLAFDPANGRVYVSTGLIFSPWFPGTGKKAAIFDGSTNTLVRSVATGKNPQAPVVALAHQTVFVPGAASDVVTIFAANSGRIVATVATGSKPNAAVYDSGRDYVFVGNSGTGNITVISAKNNTVVTNLGAGNLPIVSAYAPASGYVYFGVGTLSGGYSVTVIRG